MEKFEDKLKRLRKEDLEKENLELMQVESPKIIEKVKKTHIKKKKTIKKMDLGDKYEPNSEEIRTAYFLLTHKTNREKTTVIKKALRKITQDW